MVYDSKETLMETEGRLYVEEADEGVLKTYDMDLNGLEEGKRYLVLPEGIRAISRSAFEAYNNSEVVLFIQNRLVDPARSREEWQRKLRSNRSIKISFPNEVADNWFSKAEFMRKMELRVRFLKLFLPATVEAIDPAGLPALLEEIRVSEENEQYMSKDGVLYTKDGKTLVRYPGFRDDAVDFTIPSGVEVIGPFAFQNACLGALIIPNTVKEICKNAFYDCMMEELVLPENLETIEAGWFINCDIRKLVLPKELKEVKSYALKGTAGITEVVAEGDMPVFGDGIFANGYFRSISWWPWPVIPKACFINGEIRKIEVPMGVETVEDFAFAGCYKAKGIVLPDSVQTIGPSSFDEGETYSADVTVPDHLLKYAYRFPALSMINKMKKSDAWGKRTDREFKEDFEVLKRQKDAMQNYVDKIGIMQFAKKINYKQQISFIIQLANKMCGRMHMELLDENK